MTEAKATPEAAPTVAAPEAPSTVKPQTAEALGLEVSEHKPAEGEPVFEVAKPTKGWVRDHLDRFHEVDDVDLFLSAYPGSRAVKSGEVTKSKVGHAKAESETPQG